MPHRLIGGAEMLARHPGFALIGRKNEMEKLCAILVRKHSNSVMLVAPSGVGATALCLGLQAMKTDPNAPFDIASKSLFWLDVDALFASGDSAEIEKAFRNAMDRLARAHDPILIVDDAGDLFEACRNHGTNHFVNTINGMMNAGKIRVILEVNDKDATKVLAWHSEMRESYTILDVPEPVGADLEAIVASVGTKLTEYHGIAITDEALRTAIDLTQKYRQAGSGHAQPKRSIEVLDQSLAAFRLAAHVEPPAAAALRKKVEAGVATPEDHTALATMMATHAQRQAQLRTFQASQREAETAIAQLEESLADEKAKNEAAGTPSVPAFAALSGMGRGMGGGTQDRLEGFRQALADHKKGYEALVKTMNAELALDRTSVLLEFARISGIPAAKLGEDAKAILRELGANLKKAVFGQDDAVERMANAIKVSKVGRRNRDKPLAAFMLAGPSGVGKTEIAKQIAKQLLGDAKALTRFDMSEYMERHAVSKLIGAPPGYEGFEAGGILTNAMRTNRNRVILFDEIEKAHPDVFNLFLQILDDGRLTDNIGRVAEFSDAIIVMTTNTGQPHFLNKDMDHVEAMKLCMEDLEATYRPEFLNRFNGRENIVGFQRLELPSIERIIAREVGDMAASYAEHGVEMVFGAEAIAAFCADRYDPKVGARGLPGAIVAQLEPRIVNALLEGPENGRSHFDIGYDTARRTFTVEHTILAQAA
jgi:ATP-dependent Clp protease ATP-binding subunit ClpB